MKYKYKSLEYSHTFDKKGMMYLLVGDRGDSLWMHEIKLSKIFKEYVIRLQQVCEKIKLIEYYIGKFKMKELIIVKAMRILDSHMEVLFAEFYVESLGMLEEMEFLTSTILDGFQKKIADQIEVACMDICQRSREDGDLGVFALGRKKERRK